jgi:transcriptional regulator with PAS, ATPase and Fis domain
MVAREVELQIFWFETISKYSNMTENVGLMCLDQSNNTNRVIIMNNESIRILGVPQQDYFYNKLENIIEVDDNNKPFWDIINNKKKVLDKTISLRVNGKQVVVNLSTAAYKEDKFHINGVIMYIQSIKRINKLVSQYSGNVARLNFSDIIGESESMMDVVRRASAAAMTDTNILILGESGVGKDVFAQAIHNNSARKNKPYVAINCAAFSKELIASELFGYDSGAFTGAKKEGRMGKFELANQGTLFLDEIGDMPLDLQAILLRVLEEQCFRKVGGNTVVNVNVRIIAATNSNLREKIASGLFREDLFYRLGVIRLHVPPLRDRGDDVRLLAEHFVDHICSRLDKPVVTFSPGAIAFIRRYAWPGNVRELQNLLEGIISTSTGTHIDETGIRSYLRDFRIEGATMLKLNPDEPEKPDDFSYDERSDFLKALKRFNNNKTKAAAYLDMPLSTFYRRLKKYGMH